MDWYARLLPSSHEAAEFPPKSVLLVAVATSPRVQK
jgi:hypothetical protein